MSSYGSAIYGYSTYGITHVEPTESNIGGLIRYTPEGSVPFIVIVSSPDGVEAIRTTLDDVSIPLLRTEPVEGTRVTRTDLPDHVQARRTEIANDPMTVARVFNEDHGLAVVRREGPDALEGMTKFGGLMRYTTEGHVPSIIVVRFEDGVQAVRTPLIDESVQLLRAMPEEITGLVRIESPATVQAQRTEIEEEIMAVGRTFAEDHGLAVIRREGQGVLEITPQ